MGFVKSIVKFVSDAKPVSKIADLEPGRAAAEGIIRLGEAGPIISPVKGLPCLAFYYRAFRLVGNRSGQMMPQKVKVVEVYHSFELEMEDGRIIAKPKKTDPFSADDHKMFSGRGYDGFRAVEELVSVGMKVKIYGTATKEDDRWTLIYTKLELVPLEALPGLSTPTMKKKKKKSKAKKG